MSATSRTVEVGACRPFALVTRESAPAHVLRTERWRRFDADLIEEENEREKALVLASLVTAYAKGEPMRPRLSAAKLSHSQVLRSFNKCIQIAPDGEPYGFFGVVPHLVRKPYERRKNIDGLANANAGALQLVFNRVPGLERKLKQLVLRSKAGAPQESRVMAKTVHRLFLSEVQASPQVSRTGWPFTVRYQGRRAIEKWMRSLLIAHPERAADARYGQVALAMLKTGTGHDPALLACAPFDIAEMDAHRLDLIGSVRIRTPKGVIRVPIERLQLLLIVDVFSQAILGYTVVVRRECQAGDILLATQWLVRSWEPRDLGSTGLVYPPGAGLPLGTVETLTPFGVTLLKVDNALINYSKTVVDRLTRRLGCSVNWGGARRWMRRPLVERIFLALEQVGFQRMPSTMGSHAADPRRRDPNVAAVKFAVDLDLVLDLIDLQIAIYNGQGGNEGCFGLSPNDVIAQHLPTGATPALPALIDPLSAVQAELTVQKFKARIAGSAKGGRRPFIRFYGASYTSPGIAHSMALIGRDVVIHADPSDIRTIEIFLKDTGQSLGRVTAMGRWGARPHSLELRRQINRAIAEKRISLQSGLDPVTAFLALMEREVRKKHKPKRPMVSREAGVIASEARRQGEGDAPPYRPPTSPAPLRSRYAPTLGLGGGHD